jgi:hypothetical protein
VCSSQTRKQARQAELKQQLAKLDRELAETNKAIRNCVDAITTGGSSIAEELAGQAATLKDRKHDQLVAREQATQELAAGEGEILTEGRVLQAVGRFGDILKGLAPDEQKSLVGLFVDRITIKPASDDAGASDPAGVRRLEFEFKLNLPRLVEGMDEKIMGGADASRRLMKGVVVTAHVALGQRGRSNQAAILTPFRCGEEIKPVCLSEPERSTSEDLRNPLLRARAWRRMLTLDPKLSLRRLAVREGVVAPTLVQHFKLLKLVPEIQNKLAILQNPDELRFYSLRRLMGLAEQSAFEQRRIFREWQTAVGETSQTKNRRPTIATEQQTPTKCVRPF